jgi:hypothetical protein
MAETAVLRESPQVAFREEALPRHADRILFGSGGLWHLIESAGELLGRIRFKHASVPHYFVQLRAIIPHKDCVVF